MSHLDVKKHFSGNLRHLTSTIRLAIAFFGLLLLAIIAYAGWWANEAASDRERTLVENALNHRIARVLNEQKSVAWWDEPIVKITDENVDLDFADTEFGIFLTETYGDDEVHILDGADRPIYSFFDGKRQAPADFESRRAVATPLIDELRRGSETTSNLRKGPDTFRESESNYRILAGGGQAARWELLEICIETPLRSADLLRYEIPAFLQIATDVTHLMIPQRSRHHQAGEQFGG